jgi:hypothetical protein
LGFGKLSLKWKCYIGQDPQVSPGFKSSYFYEEERKQRDRLSVNSELTGYMVDGLQILIWNRTKKPLAIALSGVERGWGWANQCAM